MQLNMRCALGAGLAIGCLAGARAAAAQSWPSWGGELAGNQRWAPAETILQPANVGQLQVKWVFTARGDVGATPTVADDALFVTDDGGGIARLDIATGQAVWSHLVSDYTGTGGAVSRSSPAIAGQLVLIADRHSGTVIALNRKTGDLVWKTVVETNPATTLTASPVVYGNLVYIGTASNEEYRVSVSPTYVATFRGSVAALDLSTGQIVWQSFMVPAGYTGGAVWGSGFVLLPSHHLMFVSTGNNYSIPAAVSSCLQTATGVKAETKCLDKQDYVDSVVALDMNTGAVKWGHRLEGDDTYTLNCSTSMPAQPCPSPPGPDYDFGAAPNLLTIGSGAQAHHLVGAGQKSGVYWALEPGNGKIAWATMPGPGGRRGGILWGSAADQSQLYLAENDYGKTPYQLPSGAVISSGSWAALNQATGAIAWQVPVPGGTGAEGAVSVANGVVYAGSTGGEMVALSAASGQILWSFASGGSVTCGPAIVNGVLYWGSGDPYGTKNNKLYAFSLPAGP
jgi:polyvinyl alcohol dehydrogenase (cytochrome)